MASPDSPAARRGASERVAARVTIASLSVAVVLAAVKISVGLAANSVALLSDGFESTGDVLTSGLVLLGLWIAAKPPDEDHPYGHGRFETLTGLAIGVLLAIAGTGIALRAFEQRNDRHVPAPYALWPLAASVGVKLAMASLKFRAGRRSGSSALAADAWNDMMDVLSGAIALTAVALAISSGGAWIAADSWGGVAVGIIVILIAVRVARETTLHLMDTMPDARQMDAIRRAAMRVGGARGIEKCFARKTGLRYHVDLHLEVDPELSVRASHEIATQVKHTIKADLDWVADVLVHVEPHPPDTIKPDGESSDRHSAGGNRGPDGDRR